jgi:hypothetical protein
MLINPQIAPLRTCFACLLLVGAGLFWPPEMTFAQTDTEAPAEEPDQQTVPEQAESEPQTTEQLSTEQSELIPVDVDKPPSRFIPSEEISEDKSVAFPVDI